LSLSADLFSKALALLAFIVAFYALVARERKTPYLTNTIYSSAFLVLFALILMLLVPLLDSLNQVFGRVMLIGSNSILFISAGNIALKIWRVHNRHVNFRDDNLIKNLFFIRKPRNLLRSIKDTPSYEYDAPRLSLSLIDSLKSNLEIDNLQLLLAEERLKSPNELGTSMSAIYRVSSLIDSDKALINLAVSLLRDGWAIQYTTCIRHPYEFVLKLKQAIESLDSKPTWRELLKNIVVVDAYTPHFGFTDSIYLELTRRLRKLGVSSVTSAPSYAGIHTATAKAFNKLKKNNEGKMRIPALVVYENPYALVDLESVEQYRIFIRHVLPSERLWGGMFTFVIESSIRDEDLKVLRGYADIFVDETVERTHDTLTLNSSKEIKDAVKP
jgi:hypothetical protein